jgi:hypothetical protein
MKTAAKATRKRDCLDIAILLSESCAHCQGQHAAAATRGALEKPHNIKKTGN